MRDASERVGLDQALCHLSAGRMREAEAACRAILAAAPANVDALNLLAVILCRRAAFADAIALLQAVLRQAPGSLQALRTLGSAYEACGDTAAAVDAFTRACAVGRSDPRLFARLGASLIKDGKPDFAAPILEKAVELHRAVRDPEPDLSVELGGLLAEAGRLDLAELVLRQALAHHPQRADLHAALGAVFLHQRDFDAAAAALGQAVTLSPATAEFHSNLGTALTELHRLDEAIACFQRAIAADPGFADAYFNLGGGLCSLDRPGDGVAVLEQGLRIAPGSALGHANLVSALKDAGRIEAARALHDAIVSLDPKDPDTPIARFNLSVALLLDGDLERGFAEYEWRRRGGLLAYVAPVFREPEWTGESLAGRTILLHAEQGCGDTLQFCRYVPMVQALGARVILLVHRPLVALLAAAFPDVEVVADGAPLPPFDCRFPLMSLAWRFGTTLDTIPASVPYLAPDATKLGLWRDRLKARDGLKVGLVWAGSAGTRHDRHRSIAAETLLTHLPREGLALFSLQKDIRPGDRAALAARGGAVTDLSPLLHDFSDTAAAVAALDLVIAVDTAVAHLAGALARPTWVLIPHALDWRWLRGRSDSPWYPSMRLFRQGAPQDWSAPLSQLSARLRAAAEIA